MPESIFLGDRQEDELGHELDCVAGCPVLSCLFIVFLVEAAHEFLEDGAHGVVVEAGMSDRAIAVLHRIGTEIDVGRGQLVDQRAQCIGFGKTRDLIAEFKVFKDVLHVRREAVEIGFKVSP